MNGVTNGSRYLSLALSATLQDSWRPQLQRYKNYWAFNIPEPHAETTELINRLLSLTAKVRPLTATLFLLELTLTTLDNLL